jgi:hypothetical protein
LVYKYTVLVSTCFGWESWRSQIVLKVLISLNSYWEVSRSHKKPRQIITNLLMFFETFTIVVVFCLGLNFVHVWECRKLTKPMLRKKHLFRLSFLFVVLLCVWVSFLFVLVFLFVFTFLFVFLLCACVSFSVSLSLSSLHLCLSCAFVYSFLFYVCVFSSTFWFSFLFLFVFLQTYLNF